MSEYWVKVRQSVDKMLGRQPSTPATPAAPPEAAAKADATEERHDLEDKVIDESDRRPPPRA